MAEIPIENIQGAMIDLDGVVLDSLGVWREVDHEYLEAHGLGNRPEIVERLNHSSTLMDAAIFLREECGIQKEAEAICEEFHEILGVWYRERLPLVDGARETLERFKSGGVRTILVTASPQELVHAALSRLQAEQYFDHFLCSADKMKEETFEEALGMLGTPIQQTVVVDDLDRIRAVAMRLGFCCYESL